MDFVCDNPGELVQEETFTHKEVSYGNTAFHIKIRYTSMFNNVWPVCVSFLYSNTVWQTPEALATGHFTHFSYGVNFNHDCGRLFNDNFVTNLTLSLRVKEL